MIEPLGTGYRLPAYRHTGIPVVVGGGTADAVVVKEW